MTSAIESPAWPGVGSRLSVRSRCRAWSNHRVGGLRSSGVRVVRCDRSTPRTRPTLYFALPAPHALTPACNLRCSHARGMRPGDLSFSSAHGPCTPVDAVRLLNPMAGLIHRPFRPGGRGGEQSGDRATSSLPYHYVGCTRVATASGPPLVVQWLPGALSGRSKHLLRSEILDQGGDLGSCAHVGIACRSRVTDR